MRSLAVTFVALLCITPTLRAGATVENADAIVEGADFLIPGTSLKMIWLKPGSFLASSPTAQEDDTQVTLSRGYWLAQTETTEELWLVVGPDIALATRRGANYPVDGIQWESAARFCQFLTARERAAQRLPAGYVYALPTEAQWEYACRAGTTGPFAGDIEAMGWHRENSGGTVQPVAQKSPNAWGFYDMHGNVAEWSANFYHPYPGGHVTDPTGPVIEQFRVVRGGSVSHQRGGCRSGIRYWMRSSVRGFFLGFRVALVPDPAASAATLR